MCHDPALAFGMANRFLNMFVGVLSHDCVHLRSFDDGHYSMPEACTA
jgi:hypothetical protein